MNTKKRTISVKALKTQMRKQARLVTEQYVQGLVDEAAAFEKEAHALRPRTRGDCQGGCRPCPWISCKFNLYLDVTEAGSIKFNFPEKELWELSETCALDVADKGGITLEATGDLVGLTRERIRQITEDEVPAKFRALLDKEPLSEYPVEPDSGSVVELRVHTEIPPDGTEEV